MQETLTFLRSRLELVTAEYEARAVQKGGNIMITANVDFLVETALKRGLIRRVDEPNFRAAIESGKVAFFSEESIAKARADGTITVSQADILLWQITRIGIAWLDPNLTKGEAFDELSPPRDGKFWHK